MSPNFITIGSILRNKEMINNIKEAEVCNSQDITTMKDTSNIEENTSSMEH